MSYQGGKQKLGKRIYNVISVLEEYLYPDEYLHYFEPFVGFCGVLKHFSKQDRDTSASDANKDIILMWKALQKGWNPPTTCNKAKYERLKKSTVSSAERGFIGVSCSYAGIFFVGYRGTQTFKSKGSPIVRNSAGMTARSVKKIANDVKHTEFIDSANYDTFKPEGLLIYCDPPYESNKYTQSKFFEFDSVKFWNVMRKWSKNNLVIISERTAPKDFKQIWCSLIGINHNGKQQNHKECLYVHNDIYNNIPKSILKTLKQQ